MFVSLLLLCYYFVNQYQYSLISRFIAPRYFDTGKLSISKLVVRDEAG